MIYHRRWPILIGLLLAPYATAAGGAESKIATAEEQGVYDGTGRACAGELKITADRISWSTPFSTCEASPFIVKERQEVQGDFRAVYQLLAPGAQCRYRVLLLTRVGNNPEIGWDVKGFRSLHDFRSKTSDAWLSCYLTK